MTIETAINFRKRTFTASFNGATVAGAFKITGGKCELSQSFKDGVQAAIPAVEGRKANVDRLLQVARVCMIAEDSILEGR
jgi:hypothetical protein